MATWLRQGTAVDIAMGPFVDSTGNITLAGAVSQFQAFSDRFLTNSPFYYAIVGQTGTEWEVGMGYLSGSTTLVRLDIYQSSNADALVNFSAGTKDVFCTITAHRANDWNTTGKTMAQRRRR